LTIGATAYIIVFKRLLLQNSSFTTASSYSKKIIDNETKAPLDNELRGM
jgi:hypothetical protein